MDDAKLKQAKVVYKTLCEMLDDNDWKYDGDEEELCVETGVQGDDLPIPLSIRVDKELQSIIILSESQFVVPEKRRNAVAVAVSMANSLIAHGDFDYDYLKGRIVFRMTSGFSESLIGKTMLAYLVMAACHIIDTFNDKLLIVATNDMTLGEVINYMKGGNEDNE